MQLTVSQEKKEWYNQYLKQFDSVDELTERIRLLEQHVTELKKETEMIFDRLPRLSGYENLSEIKDAYRTCFIKHELLKAKLSRISQLFFSNKVYEIVAIFQYKVYDITDHAKKGFDIMMDYVYLSESDPHLIMVKGIDGDLDKLTNKEKEEVVKILGMLYDNKRKSYEGLLNSGRRVKVLLP